MSNCSGMDDGFSDGCNRLSDKGYFAADSSNQESRTGVVVLISAPGVSCSVNIRSVFLSHPQPNLIIVDDVSFSQFESNDFQEKLNKCFDGILKRCPPIPKTPTKNYKYQQSNHWVNSWDTKIKEKFMSDFQYTDQQLSAIDMVKNNQISLLVGGPGTGKTTTTLAIITWARSEHLFIIQAAPTGKASKRMVESTRYPSSTIHTMLGCIFDFDKGFIFGYTKDNPIPCDLLILDELSMITNDLMARVMEAVDTKRTKVLLIGDQDQLPSVGAGAVLRDLLNSKIVPTVELTVIHRNSGEIVKACHLIKQAKRYQPKRKLNLEKESPENLIHIECFNPNKILDVIEKVVCDRMPLRGYDPIEDIQVISPVNTKGPLSCLAINSRLRDRLNPEIKKEQINIEGVSNTNSLFEALDKMEQAEKAKEKKEDINKKQKIIFRVNDKVINTQNSRVIKSDGSPSAIVNGDIGKIISVSGKKITVLFSDPDREVLLSRSDPSLLHAYCITCHKFQGSEAPVIIIPVHKQFNYFLDNAWLYTAISRGKDIVITVGQFATIEKAIRNRIPNDRFTRLKERLIEVDREYKMEEFADI